MARLIVLKCEKDNDLINLIDSALEDGIGFSVDPESNTFFTSDLEFIINDIRSISKFLAGKTSVYCRWFWWYHTGYMPIWDGGNPRVDVRPEILKRCKEWADYKLNDLLCSIQSSSPCQIDLGNLSGLEFIPADKLKVFINNNSKVFYKTWDSLRERKYVRQIDLDLPLFEDSPIMFPYCRENTIRKALKHLLNFSYPE